VENVLVPFLQEAVFGRVWKCKHLLPTPGLEPQTVLPVTRLDTDYAILVPELIIKCLENSSHEALQVNLQHGTRNK
jgi:hypothetical protein